MNRRKERQSNIELLRIITALGVIILHYNNPNIGGGFRNVSGNANMLIMAFFQAVFVCAVNLFILISGYFMRHSKKRDLLKPVELLSQLLIFEILFILIKELPSGKAISGETILGYFRPSYWFVFVYVALYLISPYINIMWDVLKEKDTKVLLIVMLGCFSIYPIIIDMASYISTLEMSGMGTVGLDGSQAGYTIVNFVIMYLIGLYIRDKDEERERGLNSNSENFDKENSDVEKSNGGKSDCSDKHKSTIFPWLIINILLILIWSILDQTVFNRHTGLIPAWAYMNPLVITEAILFFLLFRRMKIKNNKVINELAAASFPSYLIHINLLGYFNIEKFVQGNPGILFLHIIGCAVIIYLISFILLKIYQLITKPLFKAIDNKWKKCRKYEL
ncbi:MAG: acyltransferase [Eubacterium sp.]|nr:acyltransferase [Eubacterium sp.]